MVQTGVMASVSASVRVLGCITDGRLVGVVCDSENFGSGSVVFFLFSPASLSGDFCWLIQAVAGLHG